MIIDDSREAREPLARRPLHHHHHYRCPHQVVHLFFNNLLNNKWQEVEVILLLHQVVQEVRKSELYF